MPGQSDKMPFFPLRETFDQLKHGIALQLKKHLLEQYRCGKPTNCLDELRKIREYGVAEMQLTGSEL